MKEKLSIMRKQITNQDIGKDAFFPVYGSDYDFMKKCRYGKEVLCGTKKARNPRHHKLIFAIAKCILANLPEDHRWQGQTPYDLIKAIMISERIVDYKLNLDGSLRAEAKSISFESMDEEQFEPVSKAMFEMGAKMLHIEVDELQKNYLDYL
jgi:hypothetical protein